MDRSTYKKSGDDMKGGKRLPAYGRQLMIMRRAGRMPIRMVIVTFDWKLAQVYPRIVIANEAIPAELDFSYLSGLPVQVIYRSNDAHKIHAVVEELLKVTPSFLATFAIDMAGETGARMLIIPYQETKMWEVA